MTCVCGHDEDEHDAHGQCRAEDIDGPCPCFLFEPEDVIDMADAGAWER